jgi:endonuclease YncB( thermonuclease family)
VDQQNIGVIREAEDYYTKCKVSTGIFEKIAFFLGKNDFFRASLNCIDSRWSECDNSTGPKSAMLPNRISIMSKLLSFKQPHTPDPAPLPERWQMGVDKRQVILYILIALILGFTAGFAVSKYTQKPAEPVLTPPAETATRPRHATEAATGFHRVKRIIRGDIIEVENVGQVRLIGVDTPDGKPQYEERGKDTVAFVQKILSDESVRIETDEVYSARQNKDAEGRTLAYVYLKDGTLLNLELLKQGYAFFRVGEPFRFEAEFRTAERDAMRSTLGIWGNGESSGRVAKEDFGKKSDSSQNDKSKKGAPLAPSDIGPNIPALSTSSATEPIVFVSSADKLYHKAECETLGKKKSALPLSQARASGYTPCGRCYASTVLKAP